MLRMQGNAREIALRPGRADGGRVPVLVNSVLDRDAATGTPVVVRTAVFDATERRSTSVSCCGPSSGRRSPRRGARAGADPAADADPARRRRRSRASTSPAVYRPAGSGEEVGGDFYDIFQVGPRRLGGGARRRPRQGGGGRGGDRAGASYPAGSELPDDQARRRRCCVFNDALLSHGATVSAPCC